jgi:polyhydroxybutyrate depolymerase
MFQFALCAAALTAVQPAAAADAVGQVRVADTTRTYAIHIPDGPPPAQGAPLIIALHGGGMQGAAMRRLTHLDALADARGFIAVYPDGIDKHWNDGRSTIKNPQDDVGFIAAMIDQIARDHKVDRGRVYATGISNGALMTQRLGCDLAPRIAAIAPVAGTLPSDIAGACRPARPVAVMQISGSADPIMPFKGGAVADFGGRGEGGQVESVRQTMVFWSGANGCRSAGPVQRLPAIAAPDGTVVFNTAYAGCAANGAVTLITIAGGGHAWPGGMQYARPALIGRVSNQIDASAAIVDFFLAQPRRALAPVPQAENRPAAR